MLKIYLSHLFFSFRINYKESDSDDDKNYHQVVEPETSNLNMSHTAATPSNIVEDNDGTTSDDDPFGNVQMSNDNTDNEDIQENYQVVDNDKYDNNANSDFNIDFSFENLRVSNENNCAQNVPIYENVKENHAHRVQVYIF